MTDMIFITPLQDSSTEPTNRWQIRDQVIAQFTGNLERLVRGGREPDRAALAALRSGLGKPPGSVIVMYPLVGEHLRPGDERTGTLSQTDEIWNETLFTVASLFGLHPVTRTSVGDDDPTAEIFQPGNRTRGVWRHQTFLTALPPRTGDKDRDQAIDRRVVALLNANRGALPTMLRQAVGLVDDNSPVDWFQLTRDVLDWDHPDRFVQKRWARTWWKSPTRSEIATAPDIASDAAAEAGTP